MIIELYYKRVITDQPGSYIYRVIELPIMIPVDTTLTDEFDVDYVFQDFTYSIKEKRFEMLLDEVDLNEISPFLTIGWELFETEV